LSLSSFTAFQGSEERLEQLVYVSIAAVRVNSALQMSDLLAAARPNNARDGITGVLTAIDGRFIQIIEGDADMLDRLLVRLRADDRHRSVTVLDRRPVRARAFPGWEMVSPWLVATEIQVLAGLMDDEEARLDDYIPVLCRALGRQAALIEGAGLDSRSGLAASVAPGAALAGRRAD
jgi:hypothetical protein